MKPKLLFFFLSIFFCFYHVQAQERGKIDLRKLLTGLPLRWNQYLQFQDDSTILFVSIVPDASFKKEDSLRKFGRYKYEHIVNKAGVKNMKGKRVCVIYSGAQTDILNKYYWYRDDEMLGENAAGVIRDTLTPPTNGIVQRLTKLPINSFVRHEKENGQWIIRYTTIVNNFNDDSLNTVCNTDALIVLLNYVQNDYGLYKKITMHYIGQYGGELDITRAVDNLILYNLSELMRIKEPGK